MNTTGGLNLKPAGTKYRSTFGFILLLGTIVVGGGAGLMSQWQETLLLRAECDLGRFELREWERLRDENTRLHANRISPAELETLRADHAALPRLRAELDALSHRAPVPAP